MALFEPLKLGALTLKNRIVMAPLTRCRATPVEHMPTEAMLSYYTQRATAGLIISEAVMVAPNQSAFYSEPGIYSDPQIREWRKITDAVHAKGGLIAVQLYHGGRAVPPTNNDGRPNVGPSAIRIPDRVHPPFRHPDLVGLDHAVPQELTDDELPEIVTQFVRAATNGIAAGFDAIQIHAANGYLLDQFLRSSSNQRGPPYGGSI